MSADLGSTTYSSVTWTAGDVITEAKMDSMVANDQAYDSHASDGYLTDNNISHAGKTTGAANINLIKMNSADNLEIGDTSLTGHVEVVNGTFQDIQVESDATTVTFDLSTGNLHQVTLGGNRNIAVTNAAVGQAFVIRLVQDGTGSRTVTWFTDINWDRNTAPTLSTTPNRTDVFGFLVTSTGNYDGFVLGQNIPG